jgi:hypothetical protein
LVHGIKKTGSDLRALFLDKNSTKKHFLRSALTKLGGGEKLAKPIPGTAEDKPKEKAGGGGSAGQKKKEGEGTFYSFLKR